MGKTKKQRNAKTVINKRKKKQKRKIKQRATAKKAGIINEKVILKQFIDFMEAESQAAMEAESQAVMEAESQAAMEAEAAVAARAWQECLDLHRSPLLGITDTTRLLCTKEVLKSNNFIRYNILQLSFKAANDFLAKIPSVPTANIKAAIKIETAFNKYVKDQLQFVSALPAGFSRTRDALLEELHNRRLAFIQTINSLLNLNLNMPSMELRPALIFVYKKLHAYKQKIQLEQVKTGLRIAQEQDFEDITALLGPDTEVEFIINIISNITNILKIDLTELFFSTIAILNGEDS